MATRHTCKNLGSEVHLQNRSLRPALTRSLLSLAVLLTVLAAFIGKERNLMSETKFSEPKAALTDVQKHVKAILKTAKGDITLELYPKEAPLSVTNFVQLAKGGFYDNLTFHRVVPNFVIQGGDPQGNGTGGPGYTIPAEIQGNPHKHVEGALAWARTGDEVNPQRRSSGSQFYITLAPTPFLDNGYTVFGKVTAGMEVVKKIQQGDKILKVETP